MSDCPRIGKLFGGCKFSPRYDLAASGWPAFEGPAAAMIALVEAAREKTYVLDVCERCGKTIERDSQGGREEDGAKNPASASAQ